LIFESGFERGAESDRAFLPAHPDAHFAVAPFPIHLAESRRNPFTLNVMSSHSFGIPAPITRVGALPDFVETGQHIELEQQDLGGRSSNAA